MSRKKEVVLASRTPQRFKKGQVTVFIILALIIVAVGVLIYIFYPKIQTTLGLSTQSPSEYIQTCMQNKVSSVIENLSMQGGTLNPDNYYVYNGSKIEYLCYTNKDYVPCVMQQPLLQNSIQSQIRNSIQSDANSCFNNLQKSYEQKGYTASLTKGNISVDLLPDKISVTFNDRLTLTKGSSKTYNSFNLVLNNNLYELVAITNSILNWEIRYGDAETTMYMNLYHNLLVEKKKQSDGTKIYILTDLNTGSKFQFATRSLVWPPGIGS